MKSGYSRTPFVSNISPWSVSPFNPIADIEAKEKLVTPFIIVVQDPDKDSKITISFNPILNAQTYRLFINNNVVETTSSVTINYTALKNGELSIYVRAYGAGYSPSNKSNLVIVNVTSLGTFLVAGIKKILANMKRILIRK